MLQEVKIPQDVRVQDKIIGPLSLVQIGMIATGGGMSYAILASIKKTLGTVPMVAHAVIWLPLVVACAYALIVINGISLFRITLLVIEQLSKPRIRPWLSRKGTEITETLPQKSIGIFFGKKAKEKEQGGDETERKQDLHFNDLVRVLDAGGKEALPKEIHAQTT